jgi:hypothetical protein
MHLSQGSSHNFLPAWRFESRQARSSSHWVSLLQSITPFFTSTSVI